ncbi:putative RDD family membrane protein YckC [Rhodococcus sp. 27YEA15]|uniref:RDD family protein n=1 Tax=Rhodococcus sp. 27YEA15 TaxID=3156259 RepID=UPI003C7B18ED
MIETSSRPAGIVTRGLAGIIDVAVVLTVLGIGYVGVLFLRLLFSPQDFSFVQPGVVWSTTAFLATAVAYLTVCWATTGHTVGSVVMGVRVITSSLRLVRWPLALLRAVLCVLFAFGLLWSAVDRRRRSLHDIVLRTEVVYDWSVDTDVAAPGGAHS